MININPLAQPYHVELTLSDDELAELFDKYWVDNEEELLKDVSKLYKGKKRKGGKLDTSKARQVLESTLGVSSLYKNVLTRFIGDKVEEESKDDVMLVNTVNVINYKDEEKPTVGFMEYFYWPKLTFDKDLTFEFQRPKSFDSEKEFKLRCEVLRDQFREHSVAEEFEERDQRVLVDIIVSSEEGPVDALTQRSAWLDTDKISPDEVRTSILEHKKGDLFELDFTHDEKEYHAHVKIYEINNIHYLSLEDEDLYVKAGYASKKQLKDTFEEQYSKFVKDHEKNIVYNGVMNQLMFDAKMENIPQRWIELHTEDFVARHLSSFNNDKDRALSSIGASNEDEMRDQFSAQVYKETIIQMVSRWYSKKFDCEMSPEKIAEHAWSQATWLDS